MPVEQRSTAAQVRSIVIGVIGLVIAVLLVIAIIRLATGRDNPASSGSGGGRFNVGNAAQLARNVANDGPFLMPDVSGNGQNRPIYISHTGDDVESGWHAFEARPPDAPEDCFVQWDRKDRELRADCDGTLFPVDGDGLRQYPIEVTDAGDVVVDLTQDQESAAAR